MSESSMHYVYAYCDYLRACGRSPHTIDLRKRQVRALLEDHPNPWRVSTEDLTDWLASHRYWSRATRSSYRDGLRGFYGWLVDTNRMGRSPAEGIPKVTVPRRMAGPAPAAALRGGLAYHYERVRLMVELVYGLLDVSGPRCRGVLRAPSL